MIPVRTIGLAVLLLTSALPARAGDDPPEELVQHELDAIRTRSYTGFVADASDEVRAKLTPTMFEGVSNMFGPRLQAGYTKKYLTKLRQQGVAVYLWKLEFTDGKDDVVVRMAVKSGKIAGIFLQ